MGRFAAYQICLAIVLAVSATSAHAGCVDPAASPEAINQFKSNPGSLTSSQADGRAVEAMVRDLAATDSSLAKDLINAAQDARPQIQTAIAAGLAQAAVACTNTDPQAAQAIQEAVANFDNGQFQASFAAVAGDLSTAATAAAAASAAAGAGSVAIVNPTTSTTGTSTPETHGAVNRFTPSAFSLTAPGTFSDVGTTAAGVISPVQ